MYRRLSGWDRTKHDLFIKLFMQVRDWIFFIQIYALFENVSWPTWTEANYEIWMFVMDVLQQKR